MGNKPVKRTTGSPSTDVRASMMRILDRRLVFRGDILFPCVPALADEFSARLITVWTAQGRPVSGAQGEELRRCMRTALASGYEASPNGLIQVSWQAHSSTDGLINYFIELQPRTLDDRYDEWLKGRSGPLFGALPDAKIMSVAATLGDPSAAPVLDVGAGTGRNALALAANGHPTDAVEAVPDFCKKIQESAAQASHSIRVFEADVLSGQLRLEPSRYRLALASEVLPHFGSADEARLLFETLADALAPGGLLVFNAFLGRNGYEPDNVARQLGHTYFTSLFSRKDFAFLVDELPFELVSDESAYDFEKAHTAASAWPPTTWFESWSQGSNIFDVPVGKAPVELRWLVYRRK